MLNRIDPAAAQASAAATPAGAGAASAQPVQRIVPPQSAHELAQRELADAPLDFGGAPLEAAGVSGESFAETLEDIGFAIGARFREPRRGAADGRPDRPRARSMLHQLIKQIGAVSAAELAELRERIPGVDELDDAADAMRDAGFNAGEIALLLGAMLEEGKLSGMRRKRAEDALAAILDGDEWALQLFARLEFGVAGRAGLSELRRLYQRAAARQKRLTEWFDEFRRLRDRRRKLKTLIRALAFELSAQGPAMDAHLAAVITDLKRILQFLGVEDHCARAADALNAPGVDADVLLQSLVECVEQSWISAGWLAERTGAAIRDDAFRYRYAKAMQELVKLLPVDCYEDAGQRDAILGAFAEHLEALADAGL
ncbi:MULTISPECIES: type III secretion system gatekeeper subunit SctW [Burkholderia]|uniref:type III secretion system gatekeeper subunit SctW n=1 Tax=Burkholderia TaxID=32008 RepID=UPI00075D1CEF|nr:MULTISPECIES: type III secretion system gatekeeper subunit SctW [Burkholderia]AOJ71467.1 secretion protein [Burkholderia savannae]KVG37142.1 secretion protein [Burkholderia sp. MSMB0265]KVG77766.1 secretion protein [Burkholderia sp. MSMB2040]KVG94201.1 secretion protein [Burkholderia sp. MSMB2042]KVG97685.1 secretion protein [Burkholderia sp. MSMB2041]